MWYFDLVYACSDCYINSSLMPICMSAEHQQQHNCITIAMNRGTWMCFLTFKKAKVKASSYIAQYPVLSTVQSALHFTSLTDLFTQTPSRLIWEASSHMLQLMHKGCLYTCPPLSTARYSFIQLSKLEQCRMKKLAQGFNTAAQDWNPGFRSRESEALPLSHCAL